jgi:serine phosphatase RsbU (regulator of sigma subunit)
LEIILSGCAVILSLGIVIYNIFKKNRTTANLMFSIVALASALLFACIELNLVDKTLIPAVLAFKIEAALLLLISTLITGFLVLYPYLKPKHLIISLIASTPGYALCVATVATNYIISAAGGDLSGRPVFEAGYPVYLTVLTAYFIVAISLVGYRALQHEYRALRDDLIYLWAFMGALTLSLMVPSVYIPYFQAIDRFRNIGILVPLPLILVIMNYAATNVKSIDLKKFFTTGIYWLIIFVLLFVPVMFLLKYNTREYLNETIHPVGVALVLFLYQFLVFKYLRPRIESFFQRGTTRMNARVNELFGRPFETGEKQKKKWEEIVNALVDGVAEAFDIAGAHFYILNIEKNKFTRFHSAGGEEADPEISPESRLMTVLGREPGLLYKPVVHYASEFSDSRETVLDFFDRNKIEVILPFLDPENRIIGLLALGPLKGFRIYSKNIISSLELYRIQFQQYLANTLMLEQTRATQILDHDQMVVNTIKKKIIPESMGQIKGFRISSLYINNSPFGGDYFDSLVTGVDSIMLFMSDTSYAGIDSAVLSLELYTIMHTPVKIFVSPDRVLSTMNWVIATSRFSDRRAAAFCALLSSTGEVTYSSAAFKPMTIYNQDTDAYTHFGTNGPPIGAEAASRYESKTMRMTPGSYGILYSDGLAAAENNAGEAYSLERVEQAIRRGRGRAPADMTRALYEDLRRFTHDKKQARDISIIIFKYQ